MIKKLDKIPVPSLAVILGLLTLSNIYSNLGYSFIRHCCMLFGTIFIVFIFIRNVVHFETFKSEYNTPIPSTLYGAFMMICMILASYYYTFNKTIGKTMLLVAILLHFIHILVFSFKHIIIKRDINAFIPTWYVVYNGIMVSCVVGSHIAPNKLLKIITLYGIIAYLILTPLLIFRIKKYKLDDNVVQTQTIFVAPCSLCVISYINVFNSPQKWIVEFFYACLLVSLIIILCKLPKMITAQFHYGFAALTFPMAIATFASMRVSDYFKDINCLEISNIIKRITGVQIFLTTAILSFVLCKTFNLIKKTMIDVAVQQ